MSSYGELLSNLGFDEDQIVFVRDPLWGNISLPSEIFELSKTKVFQRLQKIKQLGPTSFVYPGATHSRAAHSFGVYHIAAKFLAVLNSKGAKNWTTKSGVVSFLCAALLHDTGHFPFTHALKELPLKSHEELTGELIENTELYEIIKNAGGNPQTTKAIIDTGFFTTDAETLFYRKLLSGVLDPDKLDYLNRDAFYCGVPYGQQDIDFILSGILPSKTEGIVIKEKNIISVENVLFSKYCMYRSVYWHKSIRIATGMAKKILFTLLKENKITESELYSLDDEGLFSLMRKKLSDSPLFKSLETGNLYQTVFEIPFNPNNKAHEELVNLENRAKKEEELAMLISNLGYSCDSKKIIIDIPENISFESNLSILKNNENLNCVATDNNIEKTEFSKSSTVFTKETVNQFVSTLRKLRIAIAPDLMIQQEKIILLAQELNLV